jgi:hypothetical protein
MRPAVNLVARSETLPHHNTIIIAGSLKFSPLLNPFALLKNFDDHQPGKGFARE